jgi:hypothetical protein
MEKLRTRCTPGWHATASWGRRRRDLGEAPGVLQLRLPGEPLGELRLHRLHVGLAAVPLSRRVPGGPAQRPADGLLHPNSWSRMPNVTGWWCWDPTSTCPGTTARSSPGMPIPTTWSSTWDRSGGGGGDMSTTRFDRRWRCGWGSVRAEPGGEGDHPDRGGAGAWGGVHQPGRPGPGPGSTSRPWRVWPRRERCGRSGWGAGRVCGRREPWPRSTPAACPVARGRATPLSEMTRRSPTAPICGRPESLPSIR